MVRQLAGTAAERPCLTDATRFQGDVVSDERGGGMNILGIGPLELLILLVFGILGTLFWVWMLIDCATNEPGEGNDKIFWILIIVFAQVIGAAIYFFVRRPQRRAQVGR